MSPNPHAARLREYWARGKGRAKWNPGTPGDFRRLRRQLKKYVKNPNILNGLTANIHKLATGEWPGKRAHGKKDGEHVDTEHSYTIDPDMLAKAAALADDDVEAALDQYGAMDVTSEEAYEQALGDEVEFDMEPDGDLTEDDEADEIGIGDPASWDAEADDDPEPGDGPVDMRQWEQGDPAPETEGESEEEDPAVAGFDELLDALDAQGEGEDDAAADEPAPAPAGGA